MNNLEPIPYPYPVKPSGLKIPITPGDLARVLIELMDDTPADWTVGDLYARHKPSGIVLLIGDTLGICAPFKFQFSLWQRSKLRSGLSRLKVSLAMILITGTKTPNRTGEV